MLLLYKHVKKKDTTQSEFHNWFLPLRLLRAKYRDGTYLIREGTHAGTEKVLSVWHIDRCRHYKLFKDEVSDGCVSKGETTVLCSTLLPTCEQT